MLARFSAAGWRSLTSRERAEPSVRIPRDTSNEMPDPRDYSQATRVALAVIARGRCYFPECHEPLIVFVDDEPYINYDIAHIRDARPGNRYDVSMTDEDRRAFANLILLCRPHHELVDKRHPERFSASDLASWKADREHKIEDALPELATIRESDVEQALRLGASLQIRNSTINLGGQGGTAQSAGGGGGAGVDSGIGGPGGRGGDSINLHGEDAIARGAGGGAGGATGHQAVGGEGGSGAERVAGTFRAEEGDRLEVVIGEGGSGGLASESGQSGQPTAVYRVSADGSRELLVRAEGGHGGRSGTALRDQRLGPAVIITTALLADVVQVRDGLLYVLGGGWDQYTLSHIPGRLQAAFVVVVEPVVLEARTAELHVEVRDDDGSTRQTLQQQVSFAGTPRPMRLPITFFVDVNVPAPGVWQLVVSSGDLTLVTLPLRIVGPVESETDRD